MEKTDLVPLLKLYSIRGLGPVKLRHLISKFGSAKQTLNAPLQNLMQVKGIDRDMAVLIKKVDCQLDYKWQRQYMADNQIEVVTYWDDLFPKRLKKIYDPPVLLFYKGDLSACNTDTIGVVGLRKPSIYGRMMTEKFCHQLVNAGFTIISGLARGIDTVAHQATIDKSGKTVAVMGSGFDYFYPPENSKLGDKIAKNGVVLSEYPLGTIPDPVNFPRRNRIISGLSLGILVTEAGRSSGALITAFQALEQNREVFAIPGPINSIKSAGTNQLIKEGATLVQEPNDILKELEYQRNFQKESHVGSIINLNETERTVYDILDFEPVHIDILAFKVKKSTSEVLSILLTLELLGLVKQLSGKMFIRNMH